MSRLFFPFRYDAAKAKELAFNKVQERADTARADLDPGELYGFDTRNPGGGESITPATSFCVFFKEFN